jgi:hypothetical protein
VVEGGREYKGWDAGPWTEGASRSASTCAGDNVVAGAVV